MAAPSWDPSVVISRNGDNVLHLAARGTNQALVETIAAAPQVMASDAVRATNADGENPFFLASSPGIKASTCVVLGCSWLPCASLCSGRGPDFKPSNTPNQRDWVFDSATLCQPPSFPLVATAPRLVLKSMLRTGFEVESDYFSRPTTSAASTADPGRDDLPHPLVAAIESGHYGVICDAFLEADRLKNKVRGMIDHTATYGTTEETLLHVASRCNAPPVVAMLLAAGADTTAKVRVFGGVIFFFARLFDC